MKRRKFHFHPDVKRKRNILRFECRNQQFNPFASVLVFESQHKELGNYVNVEISTFLRFKFRFCSSWKNFYVDNNEIPSESQINFHLDWNSWKKKRIFSLGWVWRPGLFIFHPAPSGQLYNGRRNITKTTKHFCVSIKPQNETWWRFGLAQL